MLVLVIVLVFPLFSCGVRPQNVLFLAADDLRPQISSYGCPRMYTPNIDSLAADGILFLRAYVQQALCSPSRTSLLTGRRPDTTHIWEIGPCFRDTTPPGKNLTTLPGFFLDKGSEIGNIPCHRYLTTGQGKIFHNGVCPQDDYPLSWSVPPVNPNNKYDKCTNRTDDKCQRCGYPHSWMSVDEPLDTFQDEKSVQDGLEWLKNYTSYEKPFFIAVGSHKPHIPYVSPSIFQSFYPNETIVLPKDYYLPVDFPEASWADWTHEACLYSDICPLDIETDNMSEASMPAFKAIEWIRAYYSAVSYADSLVGLMLGELKRLQLWENTTVVFWGDHGYKLGEHNSWFKHDCFEDSTRAPLIIKPAAINGLQDKAGTVLEQLVEFVDIYPTLVDLLGWDIPEELEGRSLYPLMQDPTTIQWKEEAFSQYPRGSAMGYSVRTPRWRFTEWIGFNFTDAVPDWNDLRGRELYDHEGDSSRCTFADYENDNLANKDEYKDVVEELSKLLRAGPQK